MNEKIILNEFLKKLRNANSNVELDELIDEIVPLLKSAGISIPQIMMYFKTGGEEYGAKSQDHRSTISNSNKAQIVLQKLMQKMREK